MIRFAMSLGIAAWPSMSRHLMIRPNQTAGCSSAMTTPALQSEVLAVEGLGGELVVIHAIEMRRRYRRQDEEALPWRVVP